MTPTGARRLGVGALAPALGAAAHVEAGGGPPELTLTLLGMAFLTAGAAALAVGRRVGAVRLAAVLAAGQVGWHLALGTAGPDAGHVDPAGHAGHVGHVGLAVVHAAPSPGMVAAHGIVTVLVALGAAGADRAVAAMLARRVDLVLALVGARPRPARPSTVRPMRVVAVLFTGVLLRVRPLRGPPVRPAVA